MRIIDKKTPPSTKIKIENIEVKCECLNCKSILGVTEKDCTVVQILHSTEINPVNICCFVCPICNTENEHDFKHFQYVQLQKFLHMTV